MPGPTGEMTARDRFSRKLDCRCGNTGFAEVSQADAGPGQARDFRIDELPRGFSTERPSSNPKHYMIRCECGHIFRFEGKSFYAPGGEPRR